MTTELESLPIHSRNGSCFYSNSSNPFIQLMKQSFKRKIINDSNHHTNKEEEDEETTALGEHYSKSLNIGMRVSKDFKKTR